jgi:hypothetical protein
VANLGRASTLVASDAATPTLRRIERAAIAAATPITYPSRYPVFFLYTFSVLPPNTNLHCGIPSDGFLFAVCLMQRTLALNP